MTEHSVVIVGAGPTGLVLAGELALAGVHVVVVERRASQQVDGTRAGGLHARTLEMLDQRGIVDRFLAAGRTMQITGFVGIPMDVGDFPTRHNYGLALGQGEIERLLAEWVDELSMPILREREVTRIAQDDSGVDVALSDGHALRAAYLVGCDGGRSIVRKLAGIDFVGSDATVGWIIGEVAMESAPQIGMRPEGGGVGPIGHGGAAGPYRVVLQEPLVDDPGEPTLQDLRDALVAAYGTDYGVHSPTWISRFTDATRQASSYRAGRVLLAGDAAHVHPPQGGQGLNIGVQDAMNLGWKLARVVDGASPDSLLDTYHRERHRVGAQVLHTIMAQVALSTPDDSHAALRSVVGELLRMDEPRRRIAGMLSGLDVHYDLGDGHPLIGRRMPDLDLQTADGPTRVYALLHDARPVLLNLVEAVMPAGPVRVVDAQHDGVWELPVLGEVAAPSAVLVRPDGYVAWAGDHTDARLAEALAAWFGGP
ncbi:FAD-dependent monooxygenase [Cellulomonas sp. URHE0023]|uniref:FAD-dependent monooxygenase n=1 Tax=Cellulomonas sp. URHE0023 TaxID=1380354 RepID=UPI0004858218|nr:FAD-dependent monooxygenase [Cellulomonas sp. URHE0023]